MYVRGGMSEHRIRRGSLFARVESARMMCEVDSLYVDVLDVAACSLLYCALSILYLI